MPLSADEIMKRGTELEGSGQFGEAAGVYAQAFALNPDIAAHDLGRMLVATGRARDAIAPLRHAAIKNPNTVQVLCDLGTALNEASQPSEALTVLDRAIALNPAFALAHYSRANALRALSEFAGAENAYRDCLKRDPKIVQAWSSLAFLLGEGGALAEAETAFASALKLAPQNGEVNIARALTLLRNGQLAKGFDAYDWRFAPSPFQAPLRPFKFPMWQGEPLAGKSILVWTEQGIGDEVLASSMIPDLVSQGARITLECSPRMVPIFARSFPGAMVVAQTSPPEGLSRQAFDFQIPASSLGRLFRRTFESFPVRKSFISGDAHAAKTLRKKYEEKASGRLIVGFAWDSFARHGLYKRLKAQAFKPLLQTQQIWPVCVQYPRSPQDQSVLIEAEQSGMFVDTDIQPLASVDDAVSQIAALDLLISVSNSTVHLAGALGVQAWVMLPAQAGSMWYWFRDRADSPWYSSLRFFRQAEAGQWPPVIEQVTSALRALIDNKRSRA